MSCDDFKYYLCPDCDCYINRWGAPALGEVSRWVCADYCGFETENEGMLVPEFGAWHPPRPVALWFWAHPSPVEAWA